MDDGDRITSITSFCKNIEGCVPERHDGFVSRYAREIDDKLDTRHDRSEDYIAVVCRDSQSVDTIPFSSGTTSMEL